MTRTSSLNDQDMGVPIVGYFAVVKGWNTYEVETIARVTPKMVYTQRGTWRPTQRKRSELQAQFADREAAELVAQSLNGALGRYNERCRRAREEYSTRCQAAGSAFDKIASQILTKARGEAV
jgi:hypothetical protein